MKIDLAVAFSLIVAPVITHAEVECVGTVISAGVSSDGSVTVSLLISGQAQTAHYICNTVSQTAGSVSYKMDPIACRAALSTLLTARGSGSAPATTPIGAQVKIKYSDPTNCTSFALLMPQPSAYLVRIAP